MNVKTFISIFSSTTILEKFYSWFISIFLPTIFIVDNWKYSWRITKPFFIYYFHYLISPFIFALKIAFRYSCGLSFAAWNPLFCLWISSSTGLYFGLLLTSFLYFCTSSRVTAPIMLSHFWLSLYLQLYISSFFFLPLLSCVFSFSSSNSSGLS